MSLPHSPGAPANLASLAKGSSGSSLAKSLVAGKHPFADTARHRLDPASVPPRASSLTEASTQVASATVGQSASDFQQESDPLVPGAGQSASAQEEVSTAQGSDTLEQQRRDLVGHIATEARAHKTELDEAGRQVFRNAGFEDKIDARGSVDVDTRWLKPVIQETIIRREHTEYQTVIDRDIHIHHVYPKIQPIHDPDPVRLQPRHRMFSPRTGHWHEVIGDEAAIELLGEDVFYNGPQTFREVRRALLPGLDNTYEDQPAEIKGAGQARVVERESVEGVSSGHWHTVAGRGRDGEEDGRVVDGLEGLGEGVRTMHLTL